MKVLSINFAALGVTFTNLNDGLKTVSLCLAIGYTVWKWYKDWRHRKRNPNKYKGG